MIVPSRPLWPGYLKGFLYAFVSFLAVICPVALLQAWLRSRPGPHPALEGQMTFGEQAAFALCATAAVAATSFGCILARESRLLRRLQRAGRAPDAPAIVLCGGGAILAGRKRIVGLWYLTPDELGFASERDSERVHDRKLALSDVARVSLRRATAPRVLAVDVHLRDGRQLTLLPVAAKAWAAQLERRRALKASTTA